MLRYATKTELSETLRDKFRRFRAKPVTLRDIPDEFETRLRYIASLSARFPSQQPSQQPKEKAEERVFGFIKSTGQANVLSGHATQTTQTQHHLVT